MLGEEVSHRRPGRRARWPLIGLGEGEECGGELSGGGVAAQRARGVVAAEEAAHKAKRVVELTRDLAEYLADQTTALAQRCVPSGDAATGARRVSFHPPCTLQHGQQVRGVVESLLKACGADLLPVAESHLCCGSAGTYSVLQADLSTQLRTRKLGHLQAAGPQVILSANIGCLTHLQSGTQVPVRHWIEWVDEAIVRRD